MTKIKFSKRIAFFVVIIIALSFSAKAYFELSKQNYLEDIISKDAMEEIEKIKKEYDKQTPEKGTSRFYDNWSVFQHDKSNFCFNHPQGDRKFLEKKNESSHINLVDFQILVVDQYHSKRNCLPYSSPSLLVS